MTDFQKHTNDENQPAQGQPAYGPPPGQGQYGPPPGQGQPGEYGPPPGQGQYGPPLGQGQYGPPPGQGQYGPPPGQWQPGQYGPPQGYGPGPGGYPAAPPPPPGGGAPPGMYFDPTSGLTLPVGVELASHGRRIGAYFLAIPLWIVTLVIGYLIWGAILWSKGTSPALSVLKMKCIDPSTGQVVGWGRMALRDIVGGFVEGLFILPIVSFIMFLAGAKRQSLHDVIGSTVVVHDPNNILGPR